MIGYVGADSSVRFANAVAQGHRRKNGDHPAAIMVPLVRSRLPPATPEESVGHGDGSDGLPTPTPAGGYHLPSPAHRWQHQDNNRVYLPDRAVCQRYAMRFFDEIQSIYWFYSPEQFYTLVDATYADPRGSSSSASWLCSLYSIFSICSATAHSPSPSPRRSSHDSSNTCSSAEYLALAKSLSTAVCDAADADAVRALALLSLALHSACYTVTAYLTVGTTVRMAYSLGLHRDISPPPPPPPSRPAGGVDSVARARLHRLWWTVYQLDQEVASQLGYPCAVPCDSDGADVVGVRTPAACERVLDPGRATPHGYQAACAALVALRKRISRSLYVAPALSRSRRVPLAAVTACVAELRGWLAALPPHLCWSSGMPPAHRRAVGTLHLRYWTTLIHVQRPFLLFAVTRGGELEGDKKRWYEELSGLCLEAAEKGVGVLRRMREAGLLSSLVLFDSQCIQELVQVLLLGKEWTGPRAGVAAEGLETCMATMRGMECVGWCEKILPELMATVAARTQALEERMGEEGGGGKEEGEGCDEQVGGAAAGGTETPWSGTGAGTFQPVDDGLTDVFFDNFHDFQL